MAALSRTETAVVKSPQTSRNHAVMFWRRWATYINMMRRRASALSERLAFISNTAARDEQLHVWLERFALKEWSRTRAWANHHLFSTSLNGLTAFLRGRCTVG